MTSREQHTRDLLDAAAASRRVDTEALWGDVQSALDQGSRGSWRSPVALLAAAAAAALAGAVIWAGGFTAPTTPPASTGSPVVTSSPGPTSTSTGTSTGTATASATPTTEPTSENPPATPPPPLKITSLLTAADYKAAGWVADDVQATKGWGQAAISGCQNVIPPPATEPFPEPFRADGYPAVFSNRGLGAYQYTFEFESTSRADQVLQTVLSWPDGCGARTGEKVSSSAPSSHGRSDRREAYWYKMSFEQASGNRHDELVVVARAEDRLSLIVLHESGGSTLIDGVDTSMLVDRALQRLG